MGEHFLGIYGAARSGRVAVCNRSGTIQHCVTTGPLSLKINQAVPELLIAAVVELATALSLSPRDFIESTSRVAVAMSGVFLPFDRDLVGQLLTQNGVLSSQMSVTPLICEDVIAILATQGHGCGCVALASSGANVTLEGTRGQLVRVDGWGSELGDWGSAYYLGMIAIRRILDAEAGRLPEVPILTRETLHALGLTMPTQLVTWYHSLRRTPHWRQKISEIAYTVIRLAEVENNIEAVELLNRACSEFEHTLRCGIRRARDERIFDGHASVPLILAGLLCRHSKTYLMRITSIASNSTVDNSLRFVPLFEKHHPVVGVLAMAISGSINPNRDTAPFPELFESAPGFDLAYPDSREVEGVPVNAN